MSIQILTRRRFVLLAALAVAVWAPDFAPAQRRDPKDLIPRDDPAYPTLARWQEKLRQREEKDKLVKLRFYDWIKVESPAATKLFPKLRFASLGWDMTLHPEAPKDAAVSRALGLEEILAIDAKTNRLVKELWVYCNHDDFGELLAMHKVTVRDEKDAQFVWDAFCEIYRGWQSKSAPMKKISDSEWRMGIHRFEHTQSVIDGFKTIVASERYFKVVVNPKNGRITAAHLASHVLQERKEPTNDRGR